MFYLAGLVYAVAYMAVCWKRPQVAMMLVFALAPFQNDIGSLGRAQNPDDPTADQGGGGSGGPHFSLAEINLMLAAVLFLLKRRPLAWGPLLLPTVLYFAVCLASVCVTWRDSTMTSMVQMGLYLIVAVAVFTSLGRDERDYEMAFNGLMFVGVILSIAVIVTRSGYVFGLHKNGVGSSLSCAVIVCAELWFGAVAAKRRLILSWTLGVLVAGLFFTLSRGGWVGAGVGIAFILAMRRQFGLLVKASFIMVPLIAICWNSLPQASRNYTTGLTSDNWNIRMRYNSVEFAREKFEESPYIGMGVGLRKEYDATNLFWLTLAETGVAGVLTFFWLQFVFMRMVWRTQKRLRRTDPLYSAVAIGGGLVVDCLVHGMVDHYWSRGAISMAWAGAGMATYGYLITHRRARARARRPAEVFLAEPQAA